MNDDDLRTPEDIEREFQIGSRKKERKKPQRESEKKVREEVKKEKKRKKASNKEFARITYMFVGLFFVLMGYIVYFNMVKSKDIINSPYNTRQDSFADRVIRGSILDRNGNVLAETQVGEDGSENRNYPYGDVFAHVTGFATKGKSGLEAAENFNLLTSNAFFIEKMIKEFKGEKNIGDSVVTTLDADLQTAAYQALGENRGAVIVMEANTGKILSMVSKPTFDPNQLEDQWEYLNSDESGSALLNRVTQSSYAPGSTFKIVTALEYMREYSEYNNYWYACQGEITQDGTTIHCFDSTVHGEQNLLASVANSCNASFANIGLMLDKSAYAKTAKELLFDSKLPCPLPYSESRFVLNPKSTSAETMMTAMGQGETQVSPYHMALITAAVANGGKLMHPYLVESITNYTGSQVKKNMPEAYKTLMTPAEAAQLTEYMAAVVSQGTGSPLNGENYTVAGKTGTAEYSSDTEKSHSWFVGFTNIDNPELVISVIVEGADGSDTAKAVPIAHEILNSYYY